VSYKQVHEAPVPIRDVVSRVPEPLAQIVMRCLLKTPADRYGRGRDVADALVAFLAATPNGGAEHRMAATARLAGATTPG
jgi:hypothetical protein